MSKRKRYNLIPVFIAVLLLIAILIFNAWHKSSSIHDQLLQNGIDTTSIVDDINFRSFETAKGGGAFVSASKPEDADTLNVDVHYTVNGKNYTETISSTFSASHNDHVSVYQEAQKGTLEIRYLKSNPAIARPSAEFTDPKNNPAFGGK